MQSGGSMLDRYVLPWTYSYPAYVHLLAGYIGQVVTEYARPVQTSHDC